MAISNKKPLPDKPWELIRLALHDLELCEASPRYKINMGTWHSADLTKRNVCNVCLAGSVMAKSLNIKFNQDVYSVAWSSLCGGRKTIDKLLAINDFRVGNIFRAMVGLGYRVININDIDKNEYVHMAV